MKRLTLLAILLSILLTPTAAFAYDMPCWFDVWLFWALGGHGSLSCEGDLR